MGISLLLEIWPKHSETQSQWNEMNLCCVDSLFGLNISMQCAADVETCTQHIPHFLFTCQKNWPNIRSLSTLSCKNYFIMQDITTFWEQTLAKRWPTFGTLGFVSTLALLCCTNYRAVHRKRSALWFIKKKCYATVSQALVRHKWSQ